MKINKPRVERLSPTMVRMVLPCSDHGEHVVFMASPDDTAILLGQWLMELAMVHGEGWSMGEVDYSDELPF